MSRCQANCMHFFNFYFPYKSSWSLFSDHLLKPLRSPQFREWHHKFYLRDSLFHKVKILYLFFCMICSFLQKCLLNLKFLYSYPFHWVVQLKEVHTFNILCFPFHFEHLQCTNNTLRLTSLMPGIKLHVSIF